MSDPERGFRGVMSGALILQAITVLLGLPVASADRPLRLWEIVVVLLLALAFVMACAFVRKPWIVPLVVTLEVIGIATWVINPALGIMAAVFAAVWGVLLYFRTEFRRRSAAGLLPGQQGGEQSPQ